MDLHQTQMMPGKRCSTEGDAASKGFVELLKEKPAPVSTATIISSWSLPPFVESTFHSLP